MSFGSTSITITIGETPKTLVRIDNPKFGAQYYLRESTEEFTLNVRHSQESPQKNGIQFDRHNVELIRTVFATDTKPAVTHTSYIVIRNSRDDDYEDVEDDFLALTALTNSAAVKQLLGWVS